MMVSDCDALSEVMSAVVDDEATRDERLRLERHLAGCEACSARMERMRSLSDILVEVLGTPRPDFAKRTAEAVRARPAAPTVGWRGALAAALVFGFLPTLVTALGLSGHLRQIFRHTQVTTSEQNFIDASRWIALLPPVGDLDHAAIWVRVVGAVAGLGVILAGLWALRIPALFREVRSGARVSWQRFGATLFGLLILWPLALSCVAAAWFSWGTTGRLLGELDWEFVDRDGLLLLFCGSALYCAALLLGSTIVLMRSVVRGVAASAWGWVAMLGLALALEPGARAVLTPSDHFQGILEYAPLASLVVFPVSRWVPALLLLASIVGGASGVLLYALGRIDTDSVFPRRAALGAGLVVICTIAVFIYRILIVPGFPFVRPTVAPIADLPRTVAMLTGTELPLVRYDVPGWLRGLLKSDHVASLLEGPYGWSSGWAEGRRADGDVLNWDAQAMVAHRIEGALRVPGFDSDLSFLLGQARNWRVVPFSTTRDGDPTTMLSSPFLPQVWRAVVQRDALRLYVHLTSVGRAPSYLVRGRLSIDGRPQVGVPVRLFSDLKRPPDGGTQAGSELLQHAVSDALRSEMSSANNQWGAGINPNVGHGAGALIVGRTDADGRFEIPCVADGTYLAAVLLDGAPERVTASVSPRVSLQVKGTIPPEVQRQLQGAVPLVVVDGKDVDMGTIDLHVR